MGRPFAVLGLHAALLDEDPYRVMAEPVAVGLADRIDAQDGQRSGRQDDHHHLGGIAHPLFLTAAPLGAAVQHRDAGGEPGRDLLGHKALQLGVGGRRLAARPEIELRRAQVLLSRRTGRRAQGRAARDRRRERDDEEFNSNNWPRQNGKTSCFSYK